MDYSIDVCLTEFTPLQAERMQLVSTVYRPRLLEPIAVARAGRRLATEPASERAGIALLATPHPVRDHAVIRFALPRATRATLRLYDVAGKLVRELAGGELVAGEHALDLRLESVPPGMYFVNLATSGDRLTRRLLVVK